MKYYLKSKKIFSEQEQFLKTTWFEQTSETCLIIYGCKNPDSTFMIITTSEEVADAAKELFEATEMQIDEALSTLRLETKNDCYIGNSNLRK